MFVESLGGVIIELSVDFVRIYFCTEFMSGNFQNGIEGSEMAQLVRRCASIPKFLGSIPVRSICPYKYFERKEKCCRWISEYPEFFFFFLPVKLIIILQDSQSIKFNETFLLKKKNDNYHYFSKRNFLNHLRTSTLPIQAS